MNQTLSLSPEKVRMIAQEFNLELTEKEARQCFEYLVNTNGFHLATRAFIMRLCVEIIDWHKHNSYKGIYGESGLAS